MKKRGLVPLCGLAVLFACLKAGASESPFRTAEILQRETFVREVLARNPTVEAARQAWRAAREVVFQAESLADPTISVGLAPLSPFLNGMLGARVEVMQPLDYPGKRALRGEVAAAEAEGVRTGLDSVRLDLALEASQLFDDAWEVDRAFEVNDAHRLLLDELRHVAAARYAAGQASMQDPLAAEVEQTRLSRRALELRTQREVIASRMRALLHLPPETTLPPPSKAFVPLTMADGAAGDLVAQAIEARPELAALVYREDAAQKALRLAALERRPDFGVMTSYDSMFQGGDQWMVGATMNLPLWRGRLDAAQRRAEAELASARAERAEMESRVRAEVEAALAGWLDASEALDLYASRLLPATRDQLHAARLGFETGGNSFTAVIEAERSLRTAELEQQQTHAELSRRAAALARAVGRMPDASEEKGGAR